MLKRFILTLLWVAGGISAFNANTMLTSITVKAGSRGLAIVVETDGPAVESYQSALESGQTVLRIFLNNVVYGLDDFTFSNFPADAPVKEIHAREEMDGSLTITAIFRKRFYSKTKAKRVDNRNIFLVSTEAFAPYTWNSSDMRKSSPAPRVASSKPQPEQTPEKPAVLSSIRLLKRGDIEQLVISADKPVHIKTRSKYGIIIAVFENVINGLDADSYSIPSSDLIKKVTIVESGRGKNRLGVRIETMTASEHSSFIEVKPRQCVVYAMPLTSKDSRGLALWTHDGKINTSYNFVKASTLKGPSGVSMNVAAAVTEPKKRLVVIRDGVNFRNKPETDTPDNIIMRLPLGTKGTEIKKQGGWYYIKLDGSNTEGWIYSAMVTGESELTRKQREAVDRAREGPPAVTAPSDDSDDFATPKTIEKVSAVPQPGEPAGAAKKKEGEQKEKRVTRYRQYGRDPFLPLNQADFLQSELLKVESCTLVGILYDRLDRVALLEDNSKGGEAFAIRERDAISNGRVLKIRENEVIFLLNEAGFSRKFVLRLNPKEE